MTLLFDGGWDAVLKRYHDDCADDSDMSCTDDDCDDLDEAPADTERGVACLEAGRSRRR